jgi:hypothetical protein
MAAAASSGVTASRGTRAGARPDTPAPQLQIGLVGVTSTDLPSDLKCADPWRRARRPSRRLSWSSTQPGLRSRVRSGSRACTPRACRTAEARERAGVGRRTVTARDPRVVGESGDAAPSRTRRSMPCAYTPPASGRAESQRHNHNSCRRGASQSSRERPISSREWRQPTCCPVRVDPPCASTPPRLRLALGRAVDGWTTGLRELERGAAVLAVSGHWIIPFRACVKGLGRRPA